MKKQLHFIIDNKIPFIKGVLEPYATVKYIAGKEINSHIVKNADALIIRTRTICNKELLEGSTVKMIATATIGFDHINTEYCKSQGIVWANAPGCNSGSVMQYIASALIRLSIKHDFKLSEKTIGIIGHGNVGSKVARFASAIGMKVLINDPPLQKKSNSDLYVSLDEIKSNSDIITFHVPLNKTGEYKTLHLADSDFFNSLKPGCIIINSSRGAVVKNDALKAALKDEKIAGAVLDVWENEPQIDRELFDLLDLGTPHIAGYSADGKAKGTAMAVQAISRFFNIEELKNWNPNNIELPANSEIVFDSNINSQDEILAKAILSTYDIQKDDFILRNSIETFEKQREEYYNRREFLNYSIRDKSKNRSIIEKLQNIGFKTIG